MPDLWLILAGAGVALGVIWRAFRAGRNVKEGEDAKQTLDRVERGRDAVGEGRRSGDDAERRVLRNHDEWEQ